jgi:hypothetical protein
LDEAYELGLSMRSTVLFLVAGIVGSGGKENVFYVYDFGGI